MPSLSHSPSSSPSTVRTSRYSSLASSGGSFSSAQPDAPPPGWWEPHSGPVNRPLLPDHRSHSFPSTHPTDEQDAKRRRSDQARPASDDPEEAARLRWLSQSRNASFPSAGPSVRPGMRPLPHPLSVSTSTMRGSISYGSGRGSSGAFTPIASPGEMLPRPSTSRNPSLVGGLLSQSFSHLETSESTSNVERPILATPIDRRGGFRDNKQPRSGEPSPRRRSSPESTPTLSDMLHQPRRSSLTELIRHQAGDVAPRSSIHTVALNKPSLSAPLPPWLSRRSPSDQAEEAESSLDSLRRKRMSDAEALLPSMANIERPQPPRRASDIAGFEQEQRRDLTALERRSEMASVDQGPLRDPSEHQLTPTDLEDDEKGGSSSGPKYICAWCQKSFSRPSSLRIHTYSRESDRPLRGIWRKTLIADTGERPFVCEEPGCGRRFSVQSNLKRHAKVHQLGTASASSTHQLPVPAPPPRLVRPGGPTFGPPQIYHSAMGPPMPPPPGFSTWARPPMPPLGQVQHVGREEWEDDELDDVDELEDDEDIKMEDN